ncbi:MAG TPA: transposase [Pyrinomonadaceae bacterium]|nr:transposase [Pyrinomonadaceae bacterium]
MFKQDLSCLTFFEVCSALLVDWPAKLVVFVLMPDHFHLIANPRDGNIKGFIGALKSLTARKVIRVTDDERLPQQKLDKTRSTRQFWQESFKAIPLWSSWMIWQKINYIHANPVKAPLVASAKDYPWSSFRSFYLNASDPLPVDHDWWWPEDSEKLSNAMKEFGWKLLQNWSTNK